jgi:hypothetical protein
MVADHRMAFQMTVKPGPGEADVTLDPPLARCSAT